MKKLITIILALSLAATLAACKNDTAQQNETNNNDNSAVTDTTVEENGGDIGSSEEQPAPESSETDLAGVADSLYTGIADDAKPMTMSMILDAETFEYSTFVPYEEGLEAVVNEPMIGSIAHSVVLVKCQDAETAERIAQQMKENCNPRKWVCVEADIVEAVTNDNLAMLVMTTSELGISETILSNFASVDASKVVAFAAVEEELGFEDVFEDVIEDSEAVMEMIPAYDPEAETETDAAEQEAPVVEETPAVEATPTVKAENESENAPVIREEPVIKEDFAVEEAPAVKEDVAIEEAPAAKEEPVEEEKPAVSKPEAEKEPEPEEAKKPETTVKHETVVKPEAEEKAEETKKPNVYTEEELLNKQLAEKKDEVVFPEFNAPSADEPVDSEPEPDEADKNEEAPEAEEAPEVTIETLYEIAANLYNGINPEDMPMMGTIELGADNFEYSAFIPYKNTYLAVESIPMIGSIPHSVVIVKTGSEAEAKTVASDMIANINPRKWICANARAMKSAYKGNYAILVMTSVEEMPDGESDEAYEKADAESQKKSEERVNLIINNFLKAVK